MNSGDPLYLGVLVHLRQGLRGRDADNPPDEVWQSLAAFIVENALLPGGVDPTLVANAAELRFPPGPLQLYRLVAQVGKVQRPVVERLPIQSGTCGSIEVARATIIDSHGETLETLPIVDTEVAHRLRLCQAGAACTLTVVPIALPDRIATSDVDGSLDAAPRRMYLHVVDLDDQVTSLDRVAATPEEREWAVGLVANLCSRGIAPLEYLVNELVEHLGIRAIDQLPDLLAMLEFVALQACSCDRIQGASGRLHGHVLSPPGQGKKKLMEAAAALSPNSEYISAAKVSAAGLVGHARTGEPGAIVRASGGVVCLPDAHELPTSQLPEVAFILQQLIEDGVVTDSKTTRIRSRQANTATLVDTNEPGNRARSLLGKKAYISRVDCACYIEPDIARLWNVAFENAANASAGASHLNDRGWERPLRVLVAFLRDVHASSVDLSAARSAMVEFMQELQAANANAHVGVVGDIINRLPNTLTRLVAARAVACARSQAVPEDVDAVRKFVEMKLSFVKLALPPTKSRAASNGAPQPTPEEYVRDHAAANGNRYELTLVTDEFARQYARPYSRKTFERAGQALGAVRIGHGVYLLPPPADGASDISG